MPSPAFEPPLRKKMKQHSTRDVGVVLSERILQRRTEEVAIAVVAGLFDKSAVDLCASAAEHRRSLRRSANQPPNPPVTSNFVFDAHHSYVSTVSECTFKCVRRCLCRNSVAMHCRSRIRPRSQTGTRVVRLQI